MVYSESWEKHCAHIREVLRENGTAKPAKCQFGMQQCMYLGHTVGEVGQVRPEPSKLQAMVYCLW